MNTLILLIAISATGGDAADSASAVLALQARAVFKQHCHRCHHGPGSEGGDFDVLQDQSLTAAQGDKPLLVVAGKPDKSSLAQKILKGEMPPKDISDRPTAVEGEAVRAWIAAGAPAYPRVTGRPFVSTEDVLSAVLKDLRAADGDDRPFVRYFTLSHLYNNPQIPDEDLRLYRAALSKGLNSLSWKRQIVLPRAVDVAQTVYAIDVRDLDWDQGQLWDKLIAVYPYGLKYKDHPNETLHKLDDQITALAGCELAIVRADWFVATATRPPLYHTLLQLPDNAVDLEKKLNVKVAENFKRDKLWRAGFFPSGVSGQNRLVERHDALYGAYWKSYDFKAGHDRNDLTNFPLGPVCSGNDFSDQAFQHDGGELIFNLPNGLQGYLLVDAQDRRIDVGPIAVVGDALKTSGTNEIVNGLSCMTCHKHGMINFKDQIRAGAAVFGNAKRKVERLYPAQAKLDKHLQTDSQQFLQALEQAIAPFLRVGPDANKPLQEFAEPVGQIARLYRTAPLDLQTVACELELSDPQDLPKQLGRQGMQERGLAALPTGGRIERAAWESGQGMSLLQRISREFGSTPWLSPLR